VSFTARVMLVIAARCMIYSSSSGNISRRKRSHLQLTNANITIRKRLLFTVPLVPISTAERDKIYRKSSIL
jgi:hypothetical protein